jgi:hypothetical protein
LSRFDSTKNHLFTKTGSGETQEKMRKKGCVFRCRDSLELEKLNMHWPEDWEMDPENVATIDDDTDGKRTVVLPRDGLVPVPENTAEYWDVYDRLTRPPDPRLVQVGPKTGEPSDSRGLHDAWITKLERIQNADLYTYFIGQEARLKQGLLDPVFPKAFDGAPT